MGGGTRVLDCFLPYRHFTGRVDYRGGAPSLPPSGGATALAALEAAAGVEHLGAATIGGREADGYQIELDAGQFEQMSVSDGTPDRQGEGEEVQAPLLEVWLDGGNEIARVVVRPAEVDGSTADGSFGWALDYSHERSDPAPAGVPRGAVTEVGSVDLESLTPAIEAGCEVPL